MEERRENRTKKIAIVVTLGVVLLLSAIGVSMILLNKDKKTEQTNRKKENKFVTDEALLAVALQEKDPAQAIFNLYSDKNGFAFEKGPVYLEQAFIRIKINDEMYILRYKRETLQKLLIRSNYHDKPIMSYVNNYLEAESISKDVIQGILKADGFNTRPFEQTATYKALLNFINKKLGVDIKDSTGHEAYLKKLHNTMMFLDYRLVFYIDQLDLSRDFDLFDRIRELSEYLYSVISTKKIELDNQNEIVLVYTNEDDDSRRIAVEMERNKNDLYDLSSLVTELERLMQN